MPALSRISSHVRVGVNVSIVHKTATRGYSWIWPVWQTDCKWPKIYYSQWSTLIFNSNSTSWPWLSIGAYNTWHGTAVSVRWPAACRRTELALAAFFNVQCPCHSGNHLLLSVTVPFRSPVVAYGTVCQLTSRSQQLYPSSVLVYEHIYFLFLSLHDLCCLTFTVSVPLQFVLT